MINANINGSVILEPPLTDLVRYPGAYHALSLDNSLEVVTDTRPSAMLLGVAALTGNGQSADKDYHMSDVFVPSQDSMFPPDAQQPALHVDTEGIAEEDVEMLRAIVHKGLKEPGGWKVSLGFAALEIDGKTKVSAFVASSFRQGLRTAVENVDWRRSRYGAQDFDPVETRLRSFVHKGIEDAQPANFPKLNTGQKVELFTDRIVLPQAFRLFAPRVALSRAVATELIDYKRLAAAA